MLSLRADGPHVRDVTLDDFFHLAPPEPAAPRSGRRSPPSPLQSRRWLALLELVHAFRIRDEETWRHCRRVQQQAAALAEWLHLGRDVARAVGMAALLHDVGKIAVSDAILRKEGRLTDEEYDTVRVHPEVGERLIAPLLPHEGVLAGIRHHHERYDGFGYPDRLRGIGIPLAARVISVVDVFDVLTHARPYRRHPLTRQEALVVLETQSSGQLDAGLVAEFGRMLRSTEETVVDGPAVGSAGGGSGKASHHEAAGRLE